MLSARHEVERPPARGWAEPRRGAAAPLGWGRVVWPDLTVARSPLPLAEALEAPPPPEPMPLPLVAQEEVERLCASAADAAAAVAEARVRAELASEHREVESRLAGAFHVLADEIAARRDGLGAEAVPIGAALGRLLAYQAIAAEPLALAEAVAAGLLAELRDEPEIAVEVTPGLVEELGSRLAALAAGSRAAAGVTVRAGAGLRPGEVRVLWRDGWAERLLAQLELRAGEALGALAGNGRAATRGGRVVVEGGVISGGEEAA